MNTFLEELTGKNIKLSTEMISVQTNDYIVPKITSIYEKLINTMSSTDIKGVNLFKDRRTKPLLIELDELIKGRFGIDAKHIYSKDTGYGVKPVPPKNYNVLNRDMLNSYDEVDNILTMIKLKDSKSKDEIVDVSDDALDVLENWRKSVKALEAQLNKDGIFVDLDKAVIKRLPKDYHVYFMVDLDIMIRKLKLDAVELTAVLLHEVGHAFTHIEYSIRTVNNTAVLIDSVRDTVGKNNGSYKKGIEIAYAKLNPGKDSNSKSVVSGTIKLINNYMSSSINMGRNTYSATDSEQLADQFSARFGLGAELAEGMNKLYKHNIVSNKDLELYSAGNFMVYGSISYLLITGSVTGAIIGTSLFLIFGIALSFIIQLLYSAFTSGGLEKGTTYDYDITRFDRIKRELIREIRTSDLPKDIIKDNLDKLDRIEKLINTARGSKEIVSIADRVMRYITPGGKELVAARDLDIITEQLMENDMYVASAKLKNL